MSKKMSLILVSATLFATEHTEDVTLSKKDVFPLKV